MTTFDYPPYPYLEQVAKNCPSSVSLYMKLWADRGTHNKITVPKKQVQEIFLTRESIWKDRMNHLVAEGLVSYWLSKDKKIYHLELTDYDFDTDLPLLC